MINRVFFYILTFLILTGCVEEKKLNTEEIRSVYSGTLYTEKVSEINTDDGKQKKIRLVFENENLYNHFFVSKPAIANFCAINLLKNNPSIFNSNDLIEVEIKKENNVVSDSIFTMSYDSAKVVYKTNDFKYRESKLKSFFDYVQNQEYDSIKSMTGNLFKSDSILQEHVLEIEKEIPDSVNRIMAIGIRTLINIHDKELEEITMLTQSKSGYTLFNFKTMNEDNRFKIVGLRY
jgi:hypothetical protein